MKVTPTESYTANICIAFINLCKTMLLTYGCQINCQLHRDTALWYLDKVENVLLIYVPLVLQPCCTWLHRNVETRKEISILHSS